MTPASAVEPAGTLGDVGPPAPFDPVRETVRQAYEQLATTYAARNPGRHECIDALLANVAADLPDDSLVLDVGCGPGRDLADLYPRHRCVGVDIARAMVAQAVAEPRISGVVADMARLPLRDRCCDAVLCVAALLHVPRASAPAVVQELARVSAPGARLVLVGRDGAGEAWETAGYHPARPRRFFAYYELEEVATMVDEAGYHVGRRVEFHIRGRRWWGLAGRVPGRPAVDRRRRRRGAVR